jgi:hypothetical protein
LSRSTLRETTQIADIEYTEVFDIFIILFGRSTAFCLTGEKSSAAAVRSWILVTAGLCGEEQDMFFFKKKQEKIAAPNIHAIARFDIRQ